MTALKPHAATARSLGGAERVPVAQESRSGARSDPAAFTITIPAPAEWLNSNDRRHRMVAAKLTKSWRQAAEAASKHIGPLNWPVQITAYIWKPRANRYDPGNIYPTAKACLDGLVDAGLLPDDDHKHVLGPDLRHGGKGEAAIVLEIREIPGILG